MDSGFKLRVDSYSPGHFAIMFFVFLPYFFHDTFFSFSDFFLK